MDKISVLPADDKTNGWSRILPDRVPHGELSGDVKADWVVVGAGYAGLAAARPPGREPARRQDRSPGSAGGGRGRVRPQFRLRHRPAPTMSARPWRRWEASHKYMRLARAAVDHLEEMAGTHDINCDWARRGKYHAAVSDKGCKDILEPFAKELEALGEPYRWVEQDDLRSEIGDAALPRRRLHARLRADEPGGAHPRPVRQPARQRHRRTSTLR